MTVSDFSVLLVDDDPNFLRLVSGVLDIEACRVTIAELGASGIQAFTQAPAALVLLDLTLPDVDGLDVCRTVRTLPGGHDAMIVLVSGRRELSDRIAGFAAGADDFLTKPIEVFELALRVRAIRRRGQVHSANKPLALEVGPLCLVPERRILQTADGEKALTPVEFQLLHYLMNRPNTLVTTEELLTQVWHYPRGVGSPDLVRFHVRSTRKKIEPDPEKPIYLLSRLGHGYMICGGAEGIGEAG